VVTNPYDLERAREQALRIRQYHHPNIIRCLDSFTESESRHILVLERCSDDLRGFITFVKARKRISMSLSGFSPTSSKGWWRFTAGTKSTKTSSLRKFS